jgi:hypothetical protein
MYVPTLPYTPRHRDLQDNQVDVERVEYRVDRQVRTRTEETCERAWRRGSIHSGCEGWGDVDLSISRSAIVCPADVYFPHTYVEKLDRSRNTFRLQCRR